MQMQNLEQVLTHPVLRIFKAITEIPHASGHEAALATWVKGYATEHGWTYQQDAIGNLLVDVPATPGQEAKSSVCLQNHLDMVCVDDQGNTFGEERFPLDLYVDAGWLCARGTTLGADNGIGLAIALALASETEHGPQELLFTVQEEVGMVGVKELTLKVKSKLLINLDSEDWKTLIIGSAGAFGATLQIPMSFEPTTIATMHTFTLQIAGLRGGHSGLDINKHRENAIHSLVRLLRSLNTEQCLRLVSLSGGSRSSAIPASAQATFVWEGDTAVLRENFEVEKWGICYENVKHEPGLRITLLSTAAAEQAVSAPCSAKVIELIQQLPNGVLRMSPMPNVPQTSMNLGIVSFNADAPTLELTVMGRSLAAEELLQLRQRIVALQVVFNYDLETLLAMQVIFRAGYPGWLPEPDAPFVQNVVAAWRSFSTEDLQVTAAHVGLECGLLKAHFPNVEMVSLGPDIRGAHSPNECVRYSSVDACYLFLQKLLKSNL